MFAKYIIIILEKLSDKMKSWNRKTNLNFSKNASAF